MPDNPAEMPGWSACGRVMDYLQACYISYMRPFRDRPDIQVKGRWYWCPKGAKTIPYLHRFMSFGNDEWGNEQDVPVGEVRGKHGRTKGWPSPRYTGQNFCGGEREWTEGALYSQIGTPVADQEGVPRCCISLPPIPGGVEFQGDGVGTYSLAIVGAGGAILDGSGAEGGGAVTEIAAGGLLLDGAATEGQFAELPTGGLLLGGAATEGELVENGAGGLLLDGEGGTIPDGGEGGIMLDGAATEGELVERGAGGLLLDGEAGIATPGESVGGGLLLGGAATEGELAENGAGGLLLGGEGEEVL